ncbi:MAG TPA: carboxypeptidase regulatory-like domain-containing protein [Pyrinomonadaceae bacterium]|nr:carboxypeptidase regulatory-like domain-containing protein [Pyrinomonadaceae bacterium]
MLRKNYFTTLLSIAILLAASAAVFAQATSPTSGTVEMQKADGTKVPVADAVVDVYRTDIKGKPPGTKTNKKGEFTFAGLLLGGTYTFSVSAPGAKPEIKSNIKAGQERIVITLLEGDGKRWTEDEVRQALEAEKSGTNLNGTQSGTAQNDAELKKQQADYEAKVKEVNDKNNKIKQNTEIIQTALKEGNEAFNAKNYDVAIAKYESGITAEPDFVGSAPVLNNNKGAALKARAVDTYNKFVKSTDKAVKDEAMGRVKNDLMGSVAAYSRSYTILKGAQPADITNPAVFDATKYNALLGLTDGYRLMIVTKSDMSKATEAKPAYTDYLAIETDAAKKLKAQVTLGDIMREAGMSDDAIAAYRVALETAPDNAEALAGLGLSLFNSGVINDNKEQKQEGLNVMQKFVEVAPIADTDTPYMKELKVSVKEAVEYLKTQEKLTPQKLPKTTTTKKKG